MLIGDLAFYLTTYVLFHYVQFVARLKLVEFATTKSRAEIAQIGSGPDFHFNVGSDQGNRTQVQL